ncbi:MAG: hypothetical protein ACP5PV_02155 [Methanothrix sp.]
MKFKVGFGLVLISLTLVMLNYLTISLAQVSQTNLLYEDNFSTSKNSLFSIYSDANSSAYFKDGKYRMTATPPNGWASYYSGNKSSDIVMEVEATQVSGPNDNAYGVGFRDDWINSYVFLISGDGYYHYDKLMNDAWLPIRYQKWKPIIWNKSSAIHTGNSTNLIRVSCKGDEFSFYINDIKVDTFRDIDNSIPSGGIGLIAAAGGSLGDVTIDFDNLRIWENSE